MPPSPGRRCLDVGPAVSPSGTSTPRAADVLPRRSVGRRPTSPAVRAPAASHRVFRYPGAMRITWPVSSVLLLLTLPLACSTVGPARHRGRHDVRGGRDVSTSAPTGGDPPTRSSPRVDASATASTPSTRRPDRTPPPAPMRARPSRPKPPTRPVHGHHRDRDHRRPRDLHRHHHPDSSPRARPARSPPGCLDGQQNGDETDVDCGGSCPACDLEQMCPLDADCDSLSCTDGDACVAATCDDGKKDGAETDIDCGGPSASLPRRRLLPRRRRLRERRLHANICQPPPATTRSRTRTRPTSTAAAPVTPAPTARAACVLDDDCASLVCEANKCVAATCSDGVQNGPETGRRLRRPGLRPLPARGPHHQRGRLRPDRHDTNEFVEIFNNTGADVDLANIRLVLVNGTQQQRPTATEPRPRRRAQAGRLPRGRQPTVVLPPGPPQGQVRRADNHPKRQPRRHRPRRRRRQEAARRPLLRGRDDHGQPSPASASSASSRAPPSRPTSSTATPTVGSLIRFPNGNDKNDANTDLDLRKNPTPGAANVPCNSPPPCPAPPPVHRASQR
jgi:hypothetical protein